MNKLMGFYELKASSLPSVPWNEFNPGVKLDDNMLWTIRTAIYNGNDLSLPRAVGVNANEAFKTGMQIYNRLNGNGLVVYYPYFIAEKSGTLDISLDQTVIEAVNHDLWNLVTYNKKDITIIKSHENIEFIGNKEFLSEEELNELLGYSQKIKNLFNTFLYENKSILLEWSYAYNTNISKEPIGSKYLVFYEIRTVK